MAEDNFPGCLAFTLKYEGGRSDDPRDPGGRTNQGVTQATYDAYRRGTGLPPRDVYAMIDSERNEIYRSGYWGKAACGSLPPGVDLCVFDLAVNSGPARALRSYATVSRGLKPAEAIHALCSVRLSFLRALTTWRYFGVGWVKRVAACEATALQMSGSPLNHSWRKSKAEKDGAGAGIFVMMGAGMIAFLKSMSIHWGWALVVTSSVGIIVLLLARKSRNAGVRSDVLGAVIKDMEVKHAALEQTTKAAVAQTAADMMAIAKKQEAVKSAEAVIAALGVQPVEKQPK